MHTIRPRMFMAVRSEDTTPGVLIRRLIHASSNRGDLVLDPFVDSGTICQTARENRRRRIGIGPNPEYAKMATRSIGVTVGYAEAVPRRKKLVARS